MAQVLEFPPAIADDIRASIEERRDLASRTAAHHKLHAGQFFKGTPFWRCSNPACRSVADLLRIPANCDLLPAELA